MIALEIMKYFNYILYYRPKATLARPPPFAHSVRHHSGILVRVRGAGSRPAFARGTPIQTPQFCSSLRRAGCGTILATTSVLSSAIDVIFRALSNFISSCFVCIIFQTVFQFLFILHPRAFLIVDRPSMEQGGLSREHYSSRSLGMSSSVTHLRLSSPQ